MRGRGGGGGHWGILPPNSEYEVDGSVFEARIVRYLTLTARLSRSINSQNGR